LPTKAVLPALLIFPNAFKKSMDVYLLNIFLSKLIRDLKFKGFELKLPSFESNVVAFIFIQ